VGLKTELGSEEVKLGSERKGGEFAKREGETELDSEGEAELGAGAGTKLDSERKGKAEVGSGAGAKLGSKREGKAELGSGAGVKLGSEREAEAELGSGAGAKLDSERKGISAELVGAKLAGEAELGSEAEAKFACEAGIRGFRALVLAAPDWLAIAVGFALVLSSSFGLDSASSSAGPYPLGGLDFCCNSHESKRASQHMNSLVLRATHLVSLPCASQSS
jgi:hypothetical protein